MAVIVVFAAHNDDHALGMGGTIIKHLQAGDEVHTFVGAFGELSHPHYRPEVIRRMRVREAQRADKAYGGTGRVVFLGLREFRFPQDYARKRFQRVLAKRVRALRPDRIYISAPNDLHPDHKSLAKIILRLVEEYQLKAEVYAYYVYPALPPYDKPKLIVDVSREYTRKVEALKLFQTQFNIFSYLVTNNLVFLFMLAKNAFAGFLNGTRFAETFYRWR